MQLKILDYLRFIEPQFCNFRLANFKDFRFQRRISKNHF